ncbi:hypothetical protein FNF27_01116 [Cafeteria roenbergensis]|uniref:Glycoside hydrolase family 2 catalytic domain-containing protein n=2 Tax=Cafeteria roenbergensis TaxID=33653 RepID=A0A5A8EJH2_CAFRO|nr:hypothetical protein FNF27_01116 [Cafeteria roenbergensis]
MIAAIAAIAAIVARVAAKAPPTAWPSEEPFWPRYPTRTLQVLDGTWDFVPAIAGVDPTAIPYEAAKELVDKSTSSMGVPGSCDVTAPGVEGPRGTFVYRTTFAGSPGVGSLLQFMACSFYCRVFVDGAELGDHRAGGYAPFWMAAPAASATRREVLVVVNNEFNSTTAPVHTGGDFYNYAGITRNVLVFDTPADDARLHRVAVFPLNATEGTIALNVSLAGSSVPQAVWLSLGWNGEAAGPARVYSVNADGIVVVPRLAVPDFRPWAVGSPNLFTLLVQLHSPGGSAAPVVDSIQVRSGVRVLSVVKEAATSAPRLAVNGRVTKLLGVNRHTMWPDTGAGLTLEQVKADLALLKELNVNWVRGAHYPQDQRFLDLLDESGIGIWEETLGPGVSAANLLNPYWMRYQLQQVAEMVETSANHPSVLYHAFYNEGPSDNPLICGGYNESAMAIRRRVSTAGSPPTRLVTYASDKREFDFCLGVTDAVSFNDYPCWYNPTHCDDPTAHTAATWEAHANWALEHYPSKPFGISETGAGGVFEWTNSTNVRWSQLYETQVVAAEAGFAASSPNVSHFTVWQFNDIKANEGDTAKCGQCQYLPHPNNLTVPWTCEQINVGCGRPGGENHKGQVDFWRRKKQSFPRLASIFKSALGESACAPSSRCGA